MKKRLVAFTMVLTMALGNSVFASALEPKIQPINDKIANSMHAKERIPKFSEDGAFIHIVGVNENGISLSKNQSLFSAKRSIGSVLWSNTWYDGEKITEKAIDTGRQFIKAEFVKYLTSSWAKASGYNDSYSDTTEWTIGGTIEKTYAEEIRVACNLSATNSVSHTVGVTIPADSNRYSKLGFFNDYIKQNYRFETWVGATRTRSINDYIKCPTSDSYLKVVYR